MWCSSAKMMLPGRTQHQWTKLGNFPSDQLHLKPSFQRLEDPVITTSVKPTSNQEEDKLREPTFTYVPLRFRMKAGRWGVGVRACVRGWVHGLRGGELQHEGDAFLGQRVRGYEVRQTPLLQVHTRRPHLGVLTQELTTTPHLLCNGHQRSAVVQGFRVGLKVSVMDLWINRLCSLLVKYSNRIFSSRSLFFFYY